jgi:ATP-dependent Clp protease ATP-binding subunit ClpB
MTMDMSRYTHKAQEALLKAQSLATEYKNPTIEPIHILVSLLTQKDGVVPELVAKINGQSSALWTARNRCCAHSRVWAITQGRSA